MNDDFFSTFINSLDISLSDKGLNAPELESIEDDTAELNGGVIKVSFDMYFFMNHHQTKYYMLSSNQKMQNLGEMSLKNAILKFNSAAKKKKS